MHALGTPFTHKILVLIKLGLLRFFAKVLTLSVQQKSENSPEYEKPRSAKIFKITQIRKVRLYLVHTFELAGTESTRLLKADERRRKKRKSNDEKMEER